MLATINRFFQNRADRQELIQVRLFLAAFMELLTANDITLMVRVGSRLRQTIENGIGPERCTINNDADLDRERRRIDQFSVEWLLEMSRQFSVAARNALVSDDPAPVMAPQLMSKWLRTKAIAKQSKTRSVVAEAREHEDLCFDHVKKLLRIVRGEKAIGEAD